MIRHRKNAKAIRNVVCSALAAALVAGCAQPAGHVASTESARAAKSQEALDSAVAKAEQVVAKSPADAVARAELAHLYLRAGRFESAATTFEDAIQLGDTGARTALSLALAKVGAGHQGEAVALLEQHRAAIPVGDFGLALALAGQTSRGVSILSDALRNGENTAKLRQNLAYAYALDGRWREARLMAAQDVPADQLDARISNWAMAGKPEDYRMRVAGLLNAPMREDMGQPEYLALNPAAASARFAMAQEAPAAPNPDEELPPLAYGNNDAPAAEKLPSDAAPTGFVAAFGQPEQEGAQRFVNTPVVQPVPAGAARASIASPQRVALKASASVSRQAASGVKAKAGGHMVQLGSFGSEESARSGQRALIARNPELKNHAMTITQAKVNGRLYWRVSAAGFDSTAAAGMCSAIRNRGGGCIAYAADRPLPGALPARGSAPLMARN